MEINAFITKWLGVKGGAERANYQLFLTEFAQALDLPTVVNRVTGSSAIGFALIPAFATTIKI